VVHVLAPHVVLVGDVLGGLAHRDVEVGAPVLAVQLRVLPLGHRDLVLHRLGRLLLEGAEQLRQPILRPHADARDVLDAGGDVGVGVACLDRVAGNGDRVQARGAVARDGRARDVHGEAREHRDRAADVVRLLALRKATAADQVVDGVRVDVRIAVEQCVDDECAEVVRPDPG
jgi:hypothetical protein